MCVQVRNGEAAWRDTRKQLRKDHRWELAAGLEREEKEQLFEEHIKGLVKKNREMFHKLLDETQEVRGDTCLCVGLLTGALLMALS